MGKRESELIDFYIKCQGTNVSLVPKHWGRGYRQTSIYNTCVFTELHDIVLQVYTQVRHTPYYIIYSCTRVFNSATEKHSTN